jgi:HEPN domain-containing protein
MLRKKTSAADPADWFAFAEERLRAADSLWKSEGLTHTGIECLQEAVERFLKGFLIAQGWSLLKTHDLSRLIRDAANIDVAFTQFFDLAESLTEQFFLQHYPGLDTTDVGEDYESLRRETQELVLHIQRALPAYFPGK